MRHIQLNDGKYTLVYDPEMYSGNGGFAAPLRYGKRWPAFDNTRMNNLECAMAYRIMELEDERAAALSAMGEPAAEVRVVRLGDIQLSDLEKDLI